MFQQILSFCLPAVIVAVLAYFFFQLYELLLIEHINAEFEHNITQQIFVSENLWNVILISKNATLQIIHRIATDTNIPDAQKLREAIITEFTNKPAPSTNAISHLVNEINTFIGK